MTLRGRLERLEAASAEKVAKGEKRDVIVLWRHHTESNETALARWRAENPGQDSDKADLKVMLVGWGDPQ